MYNGDSWGTFISNITTLNFWINHKGAWFVALLIPLYALTPALYRLFNSRYKWIYFTVLVISTSCCNLIPSEGVVYNILWATHRLPCFFIGMMMDRYVNKNSKIPLWSVVFCSLAAIIILRSIHPGIGWQWPGIFIVLAAFCIVAEAIGDRYKILSGFKQVGNISLESYLLNICLCNVFTLLYIHTYGNYVSYGLIIALGLCVALLINKYVSYPLVGYFTKYRRKCAF